jgi:putative membrane protein
LWGDLEADVKLPLLLIVVFLIGFLPTWLTFRARLWRLANRVAAAPRELPAAEPGPETEE